ncbi:hypothetical protein D9757_000583 [Collybiopsis confluens]|uniref:Uncharacterized protein n=1 Tax=Collybiopsis confluens TaxID=2823264 RepID=A0A8H5MGU2_9AGAR|nr:hypothetical protein D9757_000583 [Collybiopsis confluens]
MATLRSFQTEIQQIHDRETAKQRAQSTEHLHKEQKVTKSKLKDDTISVAKGKAKEGPNIVELTSAGTEEARDSAETEEKVLELLLSKVPANRDAARDLLAALITQHHGEYVVRLGVQPSKAKLFADELDDSVSDDWSGFDRTQDELDFLVQEITTTVEEIGGKTSLLCNITGMHQRRSLLLRLPPLSVSLTPEVRCAVVGNVDSGKSTTLGVLTRGALDDGRGKARVGLFRHKHEIETGRTSSVGMEILGFSPSGAPILPETAASNDPDVVRREKLGWEEISIQAAKIVSFIDLAGHERYLKTTLYGLTSGAPSCVILMVGANAGLIGMSKEHLSIALALSVPVVVCITKIDMTPANVQAETIKQVVKILRSPGCRKVPVFVKSSEVAVEIATNFGKEKLCPIFQVSNVTGEGLSHLRTFLNLLPSSEGDTDKFAADQPLEFSVTEVWSVPYVGTVVNGIVNGGSIKTGDQVMLGPDSNGNFQSTVVKSMQRKRASVMSAEAGQCVSCALKRVRRNTVRKGMVMVSKTETLPKGVLHTRGEFEIVEKTLEEPKDGTILVKVLACGVCASDGLVKYGKIPLPRTAGHEIVGDVVAVPAGESRWKVGDRVGSGWHGGHCGSCDSCGDGDFITCSNHVINGISQDGGYAEYATLRTEAVLPVPKELDPAEAAPLLCAGVTCFNSLRNVKGLKKGDIVAVQGLGGLGHLGIQYAKHMGFKVVALSQSESKRELATKLGADIYLDGSKVNQVEELQKLGGAKLGLAVDPHSWGSNLSADVAEADDELHKPEEKAKGIEHDGNAWSKRGVTNLGFLALLCLGILALFIGYPVAHFALLPPHSTQGAFNIGGLNASGQVPAILGNWGLIDADTPQDAHTVPSWKDPTKTMRLVFSDEFSTPGRTFYPGDDPYWEAVDLHYWQTNNLEWYSPEAVTTANGSLVITLSAKENHDLNYQGGLISTWNKFCFTGGYVETSLVIPGANNVLGLWPAVWTMGNLGRAGYGASLEGTWPYTYDTCDVGTVQNQTVNGVPEAATVNGDAGKGGVLSYLPGQKLSRCTCAGEDHPGPKHSDGTFVGRSAPEIDVLEAQIDQNTLVAEVSQSAQWAPFNHAYIWNNNSDNMIVEDPSISTLNSFMGNVLQQATSVVTATNPSCYEYEGGCFQTYGFEVLTLLFVRTGFDDGYVTWISSGKISWGLNAAGLGADDTVQISARPVPQEPMYLLANLGMSTNFGPVDLDHLIFPTHLTIDYIRVYQPEDAMNIGCDPSDFPTEDYINKVGHFHRLLLDGLLLDGCLPSLQHLEAYTNPNLTTRQDWFFKLQVISYFRLLFLIREFVCQVFWSFPSHQGAVIQGRLNAAKETKTTYQTQLLEIQQSIEKEKSIRVESDTRSASLSKLQNRKKELAKMDDELLVYGACDPAKIEETKRAITLSKEAAIRWTENYSVLLSHFTRTTQVTAEDVRKHLEIDEEYEDIC